MLGRGVCGAALLVWLAALVGLRAATSDVVSSPVALDAGGTAMLHATRRPEAGPRPVAILVHDFAGNASQMGFLARQLARAGWAALALDLRGHGPSPVRFDHDGSNRALARDIEAAIDWVAGRSGELDPLRIALVGHGLGARAVLQQAQWNPSSIASVVALAPPADVAGPYAPPSTLVVWGNRDRTSVRRAGRAIGARLAGRAQITGEETYGDPARGDAVRIAELTGPGHFTLLWSQATVRHLLDWLDATVPPPRPAARAAPRAERMWIWAVLGGLAAIVLIWELPHALRHLWLPDPPASGARAAPHLALVSGTLAAGAVLVASVPSSGRLLPLALAGAREPLALLAISGSAALLAARGGRAAALRRGGTWLGGAALAGSTWLLVVPLVAPWVELWPSPRRLGAIALASAAALPHVAALESLLRTRGWAGRTLPAAVRLLPPALLATAAWLGWLPATSLTAAGLLLLLAPLLELLAMRVAHAAWSPWTSALAQSLWTAAVIGALFPLDA